MIEFIIVWSALIIIISFLMLIIAEIDRRARVKRFLAWERGEKIKLEIFKQQYEREYQEILKKLNLISQNEGFLK